MLYLQGDEAIQFHTDNTVIALGKFDGIHLGHQLLINGLKQEQEAGRTALVFTFGSTPASVLSGGLNKVIYTSEEKAHYFEELGVDVLLEYPFTKEFAIMSPEDFVCNILVEQLGVKSIYVGEDFHFGKGRSGNVGVLKELGEQYGFEVFALTKKTLHGHVVSSTSIRDMLESKFFVANEMLGNPYFVYGEVIHGKHLGHTIGFPTINQVIPDNKLIPSFGVYASKVTIDGVTYMAISNLGVKPTVTKERQMGLETHIVDYSGDLYGSFVKTELLFFIRPEEKFGSVEELVCQINDDIKYMKENI
ncbi:MAG: bifunctional riboflavin kinase/FAD synthetase [Lachnospiraceae bacterium]|jgi:riboflavin kinase/FMN adenylyltransferase|nr:bifunctional riboflavin kinase/FAD synthetase [Lachnospiraceae bacterium]